MPRHGSSRAETQPAISQNRIPLGRVVSERLRIKAGLSSRS